MVILKQELLKKRQRLAEDEKKCEAEAKSLRSQKQSHLDQLQNDTFSSFSNPISRPKITKSKPEPSSRSLAE